VVTHQSPRALPHFYFRSFSQLGRLAMRRVRSYSIAAAVEAMNEAEHTLITATKAIQELVSTIQKRETISINDFSTNSAEFPRFLKLPLEIRLMIWRHAFPSPKPFSLNFLFDYRDNTHLIDSNMKRKEWDALHNAPLPITLQINQESRAETLKHYTIIFGGKLKTLEFPDYSYQPLYLNPRREHVYINWSALQNGTVFMHALILELKVEYPRCFNALTSVDIRDYWWNGNINDAMSYRWATEDLRVRHSLDEINSHPSMLCWGTTATSRLERGLLDKMPPGGRERQS